MANEKRIVMTDKAPAPVGPYSQAVVADSSGLVFLAGQIALNPATGELVKSGIRDETRRVLANIKAVLEKAGTTLARVVKTTVFIADMNDFGAMNEVYAEFFPESPPARSCVEVSKLPKGVSVEIEVVALA